MNIPSAVSPCLRPLPSSNVLLRLRLLAGAAIASVLIAHPVLSSRQVEPAWPMVSHDAAHTGRSPYIGPSSLASPSTIVLPDGFYNSNFALPVIDGSGVMYVGASTTAGVPALFAFDSDGDVVTGWPFVGSTTSNGLAFPAVAPDGTIYVVFGGTVLHALNADGTPKWTSPTVLPGPEGLGLPIVRTDGSVIVQTGSAMFVVDPSGTIQWQSFEPGFTIPTIGDDGTIFTSTNDGDGGMAAYNSDGTLRWETNLGGTIFAPASPSNATVGIDGIVYIARTLFTGPGSPVELLGLDPLTGTVLYKRDLPPGGPFFPNGGHSSPSIAPDGSIVIVSQDQRILSFTPDLTTQRFEYSFAPYGPNPAASLGPAIGADGTIYAAFLRPISGGSGIVLALNPDGSLKSQFTGLATAYAPGGAISSAGTLFWATAGFDSEGQQIYVFDAPSPPLPVVDSVNTTPSPLIAAKQGTIGVSGNNFDPTTVRILFNGPGCTPCIISNDVLTTKTTTNVVSPLILNSAGTYDVSVQNGPASPSSNSPLPAKIDETLHSSEMTVEGGEVSGR